MLLAHELCTRTKAHTLQVIATAVSKAAALSTTNTTITEIAEKLGLDARMIGKCQKRFDALTAGEWEEIFDDRAALRDDGMPQAHKYFALQFWTDPNLVNSKGEFLNFVRRSEKAGDEMRDPNDRKSQERYRIHWLEERIGVIYVDPCSDRSVRARLCAAPPREEACAPTATDRCCCQHCQRSRLDLPYAVLVDSALYWAHQ